MHCASKPGAANIARGKKQKGETGAHSGPGPAERLTSTDAMYMF